MKDYAGNADKIFILDDFGVAELSTKDNGLAGRYIYRSSLLATELMVVDEKKAAGESDIDSDSDSNPSDDEDGVRGVDRLQVANGIDIPQGLNIPVVSHLAKEAYKREQKAKKAKKKQLQKEAEGDDPGGDHIEEVD